MYTIEVPYNLEPLDNIIDIHENTNLNIIVYGGYPNSPFNGGRNNFVLDGYKPAGIKDPLEIYTQIFAGNGLHIVTEAKEFFEESVRKVNFNGIAFHIVYTNMFFTENELNKDSIYPVEYLVEMGEKYNVKNGIVINNVNLETKIRELFGDKLHYVSSCTKYYDQERIIPTNEIIQRYIEDAQRFDYVVITPQDSKKERIMRILNKKCPDKIMAVSNVLCGHNCNSYWHYDYISKENKKSLINASPENFMKTIQSFQMAYGTNCKADKPINHDSYNKDLVQKQLSAGITHFKIARGAGEVNTLSLTKYVEFLKQYVTV
jgi:hypothetical protein